MPRKKKDTKLEKEQRTTSEIAEDGLRREIRARFDAAKKAVTDWNDVAKEDYRFLLGEQWTEAELNKLDKQGRPALTFNRIKPLHNLLSGYQRENSARIKVNPEGGEDRIFSESMDRLFTQIDKWSKLGYRMSYWFDDGTAVGKGWLEAIVTYDKDPIRGELSFRKPDPYQIIIDPDFNEYDLNDGCQYAFKVVRLTREQLKALYEGKNNLFDGFEKDIDDPVLNGAGLLREGSDDDYGNRPNPTTVTSQSAANAPDSDLEKDTKFTVKEYWRPKLVEKFFVVDKETKEPRRFDTKEAAETFASGQGASFKVITRKVQEMHVAAMVGGFIVQDEVSPFEPFYSGFPFFRFLADWAPSAETEELKIQGIVRQVKDPQREKNKAKSQYLHILSTQANSGWIGDKDALSREGWKKLEEMGSRPGVVIKKERGKDLREILPKGPNIGHIQREEKADDEFKQITGINPDLLGFQDGTTSGKAISLRIRQAVLSLVRVFHNYRYSKEIVGKFILQMIPMLFDSQKFKRVLGASYIEKNSLKDGKLEAFLQMVKDARYDVFVTEAGQNATVRYETFEQLADLAGKGLPIPADLIIEYLDIPNSEEIKQRIEAEQQRVAQAQAEKRG